MSEAVTDGAVDIPPFRYTAAMAERDRGPLAGLLGRARHLPRAEPDRPAGRPEPPARRRAEAVRAGHVPLPVRRRACTSATRWATSAPTATPATSGWPAATCCTRWASTRSACPPSSTRCRPARTRGSRPRPTSSGTARQLRRLGLAHDDRRSVATTDPEFYRWTQWIFLQIFNSWYDADAAQGPPDRRADRRSSTTGAGPTPDGRRVGRAVRRSSGARSSTATGWPTSAEAPVNWCPGLGTVLANEEVTADGRSERGNFPVFKRSLRQWMMRITAYADRLLDDLDRLDWPEPVKLMQRNWIGRSPGRARRLRRPAPASRSAVFTTRPDTLFGATYMVLAPEHTLVDALVPAAWPAGTKRQWTGGHATPAEAVAAYRAFAAAQDRRRAAGRRQGEDRRLHRRVRHQPGQRRAHPGVHRRLRAGRLRHRRDHGGARPGRARLGLRRGLRPADHPDRAAAGRASSGKAYIGDGPGDQLQRLSWTAWASTEAKATIIDWLEEHGARRRRGHLPAAGLAVQPAALLGRAVPDRLRRDRPADRAARVDAAGRAARGGRLLAADVRPGRRGQRAGDAAVARQGVGRGRAGPGRRPEARTRRETNTMPQWAGSCWYELRYLDPHQREGAGRPGERARTGWVRSGPATAAASTCTSAASSTPCCTCCTRGSGTRCCTTWATSQSFEPFRKLFNQGYIQAYAYTRRARRLRAGRGGRRARRRVLLRRRQRSAASTARWASR